MGMGRLFLQRLRSAIRGGPWILLLARPRWRAARNGLHPLAFEGMEEEGASAGCVERSLLSARKRGQRRHLRSDSAPAQSLHAPAVGQALQIGELARCACLSHSAT